MSWTDVIIPEEKPITPKQAAMLKRLKIDISTLRNRREAEVAIATKFKTNRLSEEAIQREKEREQNKLAFEQLWSCGAD